MPNKKLIQQLGFLPKENTSGIFIKKYIDGYCIEVDFEKDTFHFGGKIKIQGKDSQNITKPEDWVVLECVNRLLEKGYKPENISLEKVYPAGHGFSGRLDVCVTREDGSEYLLIECKTYGKEFEKEFTRMKKDGGQLFTYFKFSNKADIIMLYASEMKGKNIVFRNEIVKIEDDYRTGDVKDFYDKWSKLTKDNGVLDSWVKPYNYESKALTINELEAIKPEDSGFIFNRFLEILRHNVVSDKPNAFNKIFTLFLCKIYDEKSKDNTDEELDFQWIEGKDDDISFQLRLTDLYKKGMEDFLDKKVTDFSDEDFDSKYASLFGGDENLKALLKTDIAKLRLEKNNEFAIKEVYDKKSFLENAKVVKEVVKLLEKFKIRYTQKQQYLSDFFELLLTTGLKQESGQFFTPVPIAQFVIKSLPIDKIVEQKLNAGKKDELLPFIIDYAAGSGHFLTESMHEVQRLLLKADTTKLKSEAKSFIDVSKIRHFDWALQYVYGIEKDYRLVKVGKVGCYLHGDGLANVIHSDGLSNFKHKDYKGKLGKTDKDFPQENKQFEVLVSNPPYSVSAFKNASREYYRENDFELYDRLTDNSSEIECLFIERTKQLLKDGGVAGIILPSSILSNTGIYSKSREIILQYFDIVAIAELGSNTFMATGTNTVTLFLRRRNNYESKNLKIAVDKFFTDFQDVTLNGIEKPVTKYVNHVWEGVTFDDYVSLLKKTPNKAITEHEIYKDYCKKISAFSLIKFLEQDLEDIKNVLIFDKLVEKKEKAEKEFWKTLIEKETDKLYYFIIAYPQKVVLVKSGEKDAEKRFLGYEFSNRRGSEGIHPIQRGKNIEDCTQLFDAEVFDNPIKASTYIYKAFAGNYDFAIDEAMQNNVSRHNLVDMMTFDRVEFEKNISLSVKKKVKIESKWEVVTLSNVIKIIGGGTPSTNNSDYWDGEIPWLSVVDFNNENRFVNKTEKTITEKGLKNSSTKYLNVGDIIISARGTVGALAQLKVPMTFNQSCYGLRGNKELDNGFLYYILKSELEQLKSGSYGSIFKAITTKTFDQIKIPLPPIDIQQKIVSEIELLEAKEKKAKEEVEKLKNGIVSSANNLYSLFPLNKLGLLCENPMYGANESAAKGNPKTDYRYIRITDINGDGSLNNDWKTAEKVEEKYILKNGDVLFARSGATAGKTFIYNEKYGKAIFAGYLIKFTVRENLSSGYLNFILKSENYQNWVLQKRVGTAQPNINAQQYSSFEIPLPPLFEQQKIVSEIEEIEEKINVLEKEIALIPQQKEAVLQQYL